MIERIKHLVQEATGEKDVHIEIPQAESQGHYSTNIAMKLAKGVKKNPLTLAEEFAARIKAGDKEGMFEKVSAVPPGFINFWIAPSVLQESLREIRKSDKDWGKPEKKARKTMVIDYSHPNIAKPMSVAHLRSTIIGDALYRIFKFSGWKSIGDNHLGDWGKQFGILIAAWKELKEKPKQIVIEDLMKLYVDYNARMKEDKALEDRARAEVKKLQDGDRENVKIWKEFYKISLNEFKKVYDILGVTFDEYLGESFYKDMLPGIIEDALKSGVAEKSEGAIIIPFADKPPFVIQKSDEAFLYSTTDLAAVQYRVKKTKADLMLYVVDNGQSLHFEQLFDAVKKLGYVTDEKLVHVKFGLILGEDLKKLATRSGKHISLQAVIEEAIEKAEAVVNQKRSDLSEKERKEIGRAVGIAALKYNDLSQNRQSDIAFKWEKMLNLEGNSAPYLMYTHARLKSILRKAKAPRSFGAEKLTTPQELGLIRKLLGFPDVIHIVTQNYFPHYLTDYLFGLAQMTNAYYHGESILKSEPEVRDARLAFIVAIAQTMETGLGLLGISAPEKM